MPNTKIVGLDDDPTGIQTVHDIDVLLKFGQEELVNMIQVQRAYEINSKAVSTTDQMLQKLTQL